MYVCLTKNYFFANLRPFCRQQKKERGGTHGSRSRGIGILARGRGSAPHAAPPGARERAREQHLLVHAGLRRNLCARAHGRSGPAEASG